ncbi:MAG: aspartate--tRNA ligase [Vampirovibrionales bacterium]|nr:aspartate--tRNA ligase [Vampirovibrionales bacterium]
MPSAIVSAPPAFATNISQDTTRVFTPRTHWCGTLTQAQLGQSLTLNGWVQVRRDLGGIVFIEIRDRTGLVQLVSDPQKNPSVHEKFSTLRSEDVITVTGVVSARPAETVNANLGTGTLEMYPDACQILSRSAVLPFGIDDDTDNVDEQLRLTYRYLDLRRPKLFKTLELRHRLAQAMRRHLNDNGFLEIETPVLVKATPEGARDYLVPSRVHPGHVYALPQSPQIFKQLLMLGGMERYYQLARCFRDEDLRSDRQPEFTQIDIEMSFINQDDVLALVEGLVQAMFLEATVSVSLPLKRMSWHDAMNNYGSDKPDMRYDLKFTDLTDLFAASEFQAFRGAVDAGGVVKALKVTGAASYSRKELDDLQHTAKQFGAKGLGYILYSPEEGAKSPILKFLSEAEQAAIVTETGAQPGDAVFFMADKLVKACTVLGRFRELFAKKHNLIDANRHELFWVVDFPMFDVDDDGTLSPNHHPFTSPRAQDVELLDTDPGKALALGYDLIYNGNELGGGSIRIHDKALQQHIFELLKLSPDDIDNKFGFLLRAFQYGVPPHGGLALGFDRMVALLSGAESIRDGIAFPKTNAAICPLTDAPAVPTDLQLAELHMGWKLPAPAKDGSVT